MNKIDIQKKIYNKDKKINSYVSLTSVGSGELKYLGDSNTIYFSKDRINTTKRDSFDQKEISIDTKNLSCFDYNKSKNSLEIIGRDLNSGKKEVFFLTCDDEIYSIIENLCLDEKEKDRFNKKSRQFSIFTKICYVIIAVSILFIIALAMVSPSHSGDPNKCGVCGKTYNEGTDNSKSISFTGMCSRCYSNFEVANEAKEYLRNQPID